MKFNASGLTHPGMVRSHNEDAVFIDEGLGVFIVCDGVGGKSAGEVASALTIETISGVLKREQAVLQTYVAMPSPENRIKVTKLVEHAVLEACRVVHHSGLDDLNRRGMASTLAMMVILGRHALLAHVGDSRIYLCRADQVHQLTDDHAVDAEKRRLGLAGSNEEMQSSKKSSLTRVIGFQENVAVEILPLELLEGDSYVICSDGLSDYLTAPEELANFCQESVPEEVCEKLIAMANLRGGHDNISVITIKIPGRIADQTLNPLKKLMALKQIPIFSQLTLRELMYLLAITTTRHISPGKKVISEGDPGDELFICLQGEFDTMKNGEKLRTMGENDFFGEIALIDHMQRSADVIATKQAILLVINRRNFTQLVHGEPILGMKLLKSFCQVLASRLRESN